jgi:hypothetical protein
MVERAAAASKSLRVSDMGLQVNKERRDRRGWKVANTSHVMDLINTALKLSTEAR